MNTPRIQHVQIDYPTDRLTVKDLRKAFPHSFDVPSNKETDPNDLKGIFHGRRGVDIGFGTMIIRERLFSEIAYKKHLGQALTEDESLVTREDLVDDLSEDYIKLGIAAGEKHAEQLLRHVENQAIAQAQKHIRHR